MRTWRSFCITLSLIGVLAGSTVADEKEVRLGEIRGTVLDKATQQPMVGVNVVALGTERGATTDLEGRFSISLLPVGTYQLKATMVGYRPQMKTDVVVSTGHRASVMFELVETPIAGEEITVTADYFYKEPESTTSAQSFDYEEVRRSPGGAEDINRVMMSMPGVASTSDQLNNLVVRGGSPIENLTLWDNVELPNSNHFGEMGQTGGPIGLIDIKLIRESRFYTGGFPAQYGDRLSSVLDIKLREGSRNGFQADVDLSMAGAGGLLEGPLRSGKGSWMLSYRKSYLNLIKGGLNLTAVPEYSDLQGKIVYDLTPEDELSFVGIGGIDYIEIIDVEGDVYSGGQYVDYVLEKTRQYGMGVNWKSLWGRRGYSVVTLSTAYNRFLLDVQDSMRALVYRNASWERETTLKGEVNYRFHPGSQWVAGASIKRIDFRHNRRSKDWEFYSNDLDRVIVISGLRVGKRIETYKGGGYVHHVWSPRPKLALKGGLRYDVFEYSGAKVLSPRLGVSYELTPSMTLNLSYGLFYQAPPYLWLTTDGRNKTLDNMRCAHYVMGIEQLLRDDLRFTVEIYDKEYKDYPIGVSDSSRVMVNQAKGHGRGIDLFLQRKLSGSVYGLISYSYSMSRAWTPDDGWFNWDFDYRHMFTLTGGYRLSNSWEFSAKWRYMGGRPHTPIEDKVQLSTGEWDPIYDQTRLNALRHPPYHRLDLRFDHRSHFKRWNLVSYLEVWNVYNRKNIWGYNWDRDTGEQDAVYQYNFFPVGGVSLEF